MTDGENPTMPTTIAATGQLPTRTKCSWRKYVKLDGTADRTRFFFAVSIMFGLEFCLCRVQLQLLWALLVLLGCFPLSDNGFSVVIIDTMPLLLKRYIVGSDSSKHMCWIISIIDTAHSHSHIHTHSHFGTCRQLCATESEGKRARDWKRVR